MTDVYPRNVSRKNGSRDQSTSCMSCGRCAGDDGRNYAAAVHGTWLSTLQFEPVALRIIGQLQANDAILIRAKTAGGKQQRRQNLVLLGEAPVERVQGLAWRAALPKLLRQPRQPLHLPMM